MYAKEGCQIIVKSLSNLYRDIKAPNILMHGGVSSEELDSIQSWFRDPERVKQIESEAKAYGK